MVPVLNHEISEGANDPAQVNLYSGSKSHCKNIDHCQALHQIHCGRVLFSCCRVTENTVMKICIRELIIAEVQPLDRCCKGSD